ncbi:MAG: quinolinate synthase NadA [Chloroflexi bacterium]|nr:quinolinate synthase NadA [Chloroflexota bacterium]
MKIVDEIAALRDERQAVILAHNYQIPEIQDIADFTGDSLALARRAASTDKPVIVFCGVHFMAETASILCPDKTVLLPDLEAGCSLADSISADDLRTWKAQFPEAVVVAYVNTSADVKAEADYCCTSGNAVQVVETIPEDREILFLPDMFLGAHVERVTGRKLRLWMGECHVHAGIGADELAGLAREYPQAEALIHPECGCTTPVLYLADEGKLPLPVSVMSTEAMVKHAAQSPHQQFLVATEIGILHRMRQVAPQKQIVPVNPRSSCHFMKRITLDKLRDALLHMQYEVKVDASVASRARLPIERMTSIG